MNINAIDDNPTGDDDRRFDLLVDDELSQQERHRLLSGLDEEPGGWRRLAMAFLEAQSWRKELGAFLRESDVRKPAVRPAERRSHPAWQVFTWAAMAASFLVAVMIGWRLQDTWRRGGAEPRSPIAVVADAGRLQQPAEQPAAVTHPQPTAPDAGRPAQPPGEPWQMVALSGPKGSQGASGAIRLPARARRSIDGDWLNSLPAAVPDDVLQAFERTGHRVQQRRDLLPVEMPDGRRMVVPVDQMDVHYVGNPTL